MTGQLLEMRRLIYFTLINIIIAFVSQSLGLMLGAIFMENASAAVFLGPITNVPLLLFGGFFVRLSTIPVYLRYFSYLSFVRYAFEAIVVTLYGFDRCHVDINELKNSTLKLDWVDYANMLLGENGENFVNTLAKSLGGTYDPSSGKPYHSSVLDQYNIHEDMFFINLGILLIFFIVLRVITYFVLNAKINKKF